MTKEKQLTSFIRQMEKEEAKYIYDNPAGFVYDEGDAFVVYRYGETCGHSDCAFVRELDGLGLAIARLDYIHARKAGLPSPSAKDAMDKADKLAHRI